MLLESTMENAPPRRELTQEPAPLAGAEIDEEVSS
jgi:hypothetical protein